MRYENANASLTEAPEVVLIGDSITDNWDDADPDFSRRTISPVEAFQARQ